MGSSWQGRELHDARVRGMLSNSLNLDIETYIAIGVCYHTWENIVGYEILEVGRISGICFLRKFFLAGLLPTHS